ncbi:hypothetical protein [Mycobacterium sp. AZCC_0083]|uniref:Mu transposase domain-containing protein n=1 Tax=Mycobacterium sp. AZCC_0083 TaxID=2735882 RepID=UPI0035CA0260
MSWNRSQTSPGRRRLRADAGDGAQPLRQSGGSSCRRPVARRPSGQRQAHGSRPGRTRGKRAKYARDRHQRGDCRGHRDDRARASVRQCFYSVSARYAGRRLPVRSAARTVEIYDGPRLVARHDRAVGRYVEVLARLLPAAGRATPDVAAPPFRKRFALTLSSRV